MLPDLHVSQSLFQTCSQNFETAHNLQGYKISFKVQKLIQSIFEPFTSFALATTLDKLSFSKQKLSQSASMQLQIAMNILYDLMMQCLHCLSNVHDQIRYSTNLSTDDYR